MVLSELDLKEGIRVWNTVHYKTELYGMVKYFANHVLNWLSVEI